MVYNKLVGVNLKKTYLFAGILTCFCTLAAPTQTTGNNGLQLTGSVIWVEPRTLTCQGKKESCEFEIDLLLQFRNNNTSPVIIFSPGRSQFLGDKKISFFGGVSKTSSESTSTTIKWKNPYVSVGYNYDPFEGLVRSLLLVDHPFGDFIVLPPEGYHEWRETLVTPLGYKLKKELDPKRKDQYILSAIPEYPALKVEYFLSLRNRREAPNALEKAKENWKEFGDLLLDSNGDYRIESEIILNNLP